MAFLMFYTDPGSGMMLLQLVLAGLAGGLFYFRKFFFTIFNRGNTTDKSPNIQEQSSKGNEKE